MDRLRAAMMANPYDVERRNAAAMMAPPPGQMVRAIRDPGGSPMAPPAPGLRDAMAGMSMPQAEAAPIWQGQQTAPRPTMAQAESAPIWQGSGAPPAADPQVQQDLAAILAAGAAPDMAPRPAPMPQGGAAPSYAAPSGAPAPAPQQREDLGLAAAMRRRQRRKSGMDR